MIATVTVITADRTGGAATIDHDRGRTSYTLDVQRRAPYTRTIWTAGVLVPGALGDALSELAETSIRNGRGVRTYSLTVEGDRVVVRGLERAA